MGLPYSLGTLRLYVEKINLFIRVICNIWTVILIIQTFEHKHSDKYLSKLFEKTPSKKKFYSGLNVHTNVHNCACTDTHTHITEQKFHETMFTLFT